MIDANFLYLIDSQSDDVLKSNGRMQNLRRRFQQFNFQSHVKEMIKK